jgi:nucleotide-binding universal stress UspA family protein
MQRFKNILVVYQNAIGDDATLDRATLLAKRNGSRLTLVEVLDVETGGHLESAEQRRQHLDRIADSIRWRGVSVERTEVLVGTPFLEITRQVLRRRHDLVMMTTDGMAGGLKRVLFGSTSMHLMRKCPCPVWVTKGASRRYRGILAAVDPGSGTEAQTMLNTTILQLAVSLARIEGSELHVVHTWALRGRELETSRSEITEQMREALLKRAAAPYRERLEAVVSEHDFRGLRHQNHLLEGRPEQRIPEFAAKHDIELIVMGTICRTGVPGFFIGNTAETVLQSVDCSVITAKPPGFVTPVTAIDGQTIVPPKAAAG